MSQVTVASMPLGDLPLSRGSLDRAAHRRSEPDLVSTLLADPATRVAVLVAESMEVLPDGALALRAPSPDDRHRLAFFLGEEVQAAGTARVAHLAVVGDPTEAGHGDSETLRTAGEELGDRDAGVFTTAQALANWHAAHQFCPRCGAPTTPEQAGWVRRCSRDGTEHYPRTDPAVIMAVVDDDDRLLLGRARTGRRAASPCWPGSSSRGVVRGGGRPRGRGGGRHHGDRRHLPRQPAVAVPLVGDDRLPRPRHDRAHHPDPVEMAEARWFTREEYRDALPPGVRTPGGISIAQRLIEHWLGRASPTSSTPGLA